MNHVVVWIDQKEARLFDVKADEVSRTLIHAPGPHLHRHVHEQETRHHNHPDDDHRFFREVVRALEGRTGQVLVVGPAQAKLHFVRFARAEDPKLEERIVGVETMDHPTDGQLIAYVRQYFSEPAPSR